MEDSINIEIKNLLGKSTVKRRKAAIRIRKNSDYLFCSALKEAFKLEGETGSWQTKVELLKAIGQSKCLEARDILQSLIFTAANEYDMVKLESAKSWIRIMRKNNNDVTSVLRVLKECNYSAKEGALEVLGYDKMIPDKKSQKLIIALCLNFGLERPEGFTDPRYGLAAACAGWDSELTKDFLDCCVKSDDVPLAYVAKHSLKRKYVRLR